ncbi:MAG: NusG domain II-containing protein [Clostridia bacterium]|nr:NusG domain II-containing protein [Clostridia bacterium]
MKKGDILICILVFMLGILLLFTQFNAGIADTVEIYSGGNLYGEYDLHTDNTIIVKSSYGQNTVCIENDYVYVSESDCDDKNEIFQGKINREGQTLICLPNRLIVAVKGRSESVDSISY